jgi:hypothetical protein
MKKIVSTSLMIALLSTFVGVSLVHASPKRQGGGHSEANAERHERNNTNENANGHFSDDKKTGLERAEERMSPQGKKHSKALKRHEREESRERSNPPSPFQGSSSSPTSSNSTNPTTSNSPSPTPTQPQR